MLKKLNKSEKGFTIIEVLIVLAIAALILLIVFLAVPALQRNSRNTQRKNDIAAVLAALSDFSTNNQGKLADKCSGTTTITLDTQAAGSTTNQANQGYYNIGCVFPPTAPAKGNDYIAAAGTTVAAGTFIDAAHDYAQFASGTTCNANASVAGGTRSWTAIYTIENGNNSYAQQCQSS